MLTRGDETAVAFIDDTLLLAHGKTLSEANRRVKHMMEWPSGRLDWSCTHHCDFTIDKLELWD